MQSYINKEIFNSLETDGINYGLYKTRSWKEVKSTNFYQLKTQNNNTLAETAYPAIIKSLATGGSQHNIIAMFEGDDYSGSIKLRNRLQFKDSNDVAKSEIIGLLNRVDSKFKNKMRFFVKLLFPFLPLREHFTRNDLLHKYLKDLAEKFSSELSENTERGPEIAKWFVNIIGNTEEEMQDNVEDESYEKLIYFLTIVIEVIGKVKVLNVLFEDCSDCFISRFKVPTEQAYEDWTIRVFNLDNQVEPDVTYII
jgi:hypothetical protein